MDRPDAIAVRAYLMGLQDRICAALEARDGQAWFREDRFEDPFAPTSHANYRFFLAEAPNAAPVWWFGGGFDLTPRDWLGTGES